MNDLDKHVSPELREAIQRFGFDKLAAKMYGVDEINEKTASTIVGTNLMTRLAEQRQIATGLAALQELNKDAAFLVDDLVGGAIGYNQGKKQRARGEEHTFGPGQVAATVFVPGGAGYQLGRFAGHNTKDKKKDEKKKDKE